MEPESPPPPRTRRRVLLATWGTTGDIAPYTGLATGLKNAGHDVTVVTSNRYVDAFRQHGLGVRAMPLDEYEAAIGQLPTRRARLHNAREMATVAARCLLEAASEGTEFLLAHPLLHPQAALIGRGLGVPCIGTYTVSHAMMLPRLLAGNPRHRYRLADAVVRMILSPIYKPGTAYLRRELGLTPSAVEDMTLPTSRHTVRYGFGAALLPRRLRFPTSHQVVGAWSPQRPEGWEPDARIRDFLDSGPAPVYFGFGSMRGINHDHLAHAITGVVQRLRIRAVVQSGWAELQSHGDDILNIGDCPHDWLFPRMRAAVHHAGPGTTHACLQAATPVLPVPVALDQPFWASRLHVLGLAPTVIPQQRLTGANLTRALEQLLTDEHYRLRTDRMSRALRQQDGITAILEDLARPLGSAHLTG
ncbi:glycosyltransferase [Streptomyces melanogenes]|uniref:Glycosyltransferase n=1 Tax=Streptomyces melanogenes TaxID=67326 RepID=A0ABZ1XCH0_9ACTN|nr:glycosyltransferase [Streptomyces melanogenes]